MPPSPPMFRATWTKFAVQGVNTLAPPLRTRIRAQIGEERLTRLRHASLTEWLPADVHCAVAAAVADTLSTEAARQFWGDRIRASLDTTLLRPLIAGAYRLFGRTPHAVLRMSPQAYLLIARDAGTVTVEYREPETVLVSFRGVPRPLCAAPILAIWHGQCEAVLTHLRTPGQVTVDCDLDAGQYTFHVRYQQRAATT